MTTTTFNIDKTIGVHVFLQEVAPLYILGKTTNMTLTTPHCMYASCKSDKLPAKQEERASGATRRREGMQERHHDGFIHGVVQREDSGVKLVVTTLENISPFHICRNSR